MPAAAAITVRNAAAAAVLTLLRWAAIMVANAAAPGNGCLDADAAAIIMTSDATPSDGCAAAAAAASVVR